ncbi:TPA: hypothetical protein ACH3X2_14275 [Trebouxia sp. C0005]
MHCDAMWPDPDLRQLLWEENECPLIDHVTTQEPHKYNKSGSSFCICLHVMCLETRQQRQRACCRPCYVHLQGQQLADKSVHKHGRKSFGCRYQHAVWTLLVFCCAGYKAQELVEV